MKNNSRNITMRSLLILTGGLLPGIAFSQELADIQTTSYFSNPLFNTLLVIIILLAVMILALGSALKNVIDSDAFVDKPKAEKEGGDPGAAKSAGLFVLLMLLSTAAFSQDEVAAAAHGNRIGGLDPFAFYLMLVVIAIELIVLYVLFNTFKKILGVNAAPVKPAARIKPKTKTILDRLNDTVEIEKEESILLDHDYDGIRELDNNLPPWWKYGFYLTAVVAVIYMINYHVTGTSPLQKEEYAISVKKAEAEIAEYMKSSANNVDENTVKLLTDAAELASGKDLFESNCAACHGRLGEGGVGPNLTDAYWLHGGGVKDIFKTIKYGWADKGMKSWKEDFSPVQIAQITSFIRSLQGSNPPKAKDRQGELYTEQAAPSDSTTVVPDSANVTVSQLPQ